VSDEQEIHSMEIEVLDVARHVPSELRIRLVSRRVEADEDDTHVEATEETR
jgi:hypothetical protein